jgi:hypothetical protein
VRIERDEDCLIAREDKNSRRTRRNAKRGSEIFTIKRRKTEKLTNRKDEKRSDDVDEDQQKQDRD